MHSYWAMNLDTRCVQLTVGLAVGCIVGLNDGELDGLGVGSLVGFV